MTQQEQFEADYLAAFPHKNNAMAICKEGNGQYLYTATEKAYEVWLQQAKRHEAEIAGLVGVCKQALYALKGREHDQFLRDIIAKYEVKK